MAFSETCLYGVWVCRSREDQGYVALGLRLFHMRKNVFDSNENAIPLRSTYAFLRKASLPVE